MYNLGEYSLLFYQSQPYSSENCLTYTQISDYVGHTAAHALSTTTYCR